VFRATRSSRKRVADLPHLRDLFLVAEALEVSLSVFFVSAFFHPVAYYFYFYYIGGLAVASRTVTNHALRSADRGIVPSSIDTRCDGWWRVPAVSMKRSWNA